MVNWNPAWAKAIANIESRGSGGYRAIGPKTRSGDRAYGKYQVMGDNLPKWTKKYFGKVLSPQEFLNNPEAQEAVFRGEFGSYVNQYGNPQDAASMWFTGRPVSSGKKRSDGYNTGAQYVTKFNKFLGGSKMAQAQANPNILLSLFGGGNTSTPFVADEPKGILERLGLQKMVEGAEGETGQKFYNRDSFANMINRIGAAASGDPFVQQMAQDRIAGREAKKTANKTAEYLNSIGQTDLANAIGQGLIDGPSAMQRLFGLQDAQKAAELEQYRYYRDLADQRLDTQSDRDYLDAVAKRERTEKLADLATNREFQLKLRQIDQADKETLVRLRDELANDPNSFENQILLEQLEMKEVELADKLATSAVNRDATQANMEATEASTAGQLIENEAAQGELDAANNQTNNEPSLYTFDEMDLKDINIVDAARKDPVGLIERAANSIWTFLGNEDIGPDADNSNLNVLNNMIKSGLAKTLTDRGSVTELEELKKITFGINQTNSQMAANMEALLPLLKSSYEYAVANADTGTANQKAKNKNIIDRYPRIIDILERSLKQYKTGDTITPDVGEDGQAVMDEADKIIEMLSGAGQ